MAKSQNDRAVIDLVINGQQAKTSLKEVELAVTTTKAAWKKLKETDAGYEQKTQELQKLLATQRQMNANLNQTTIAWGRFKANMGSVSLGVVGGNLLSSGISAAASAIPAAINKYREFNAASQELSAVTGATGKDLEYLNKTAARTGPAFGKSGAEMLEAYKLMASAKPELLDQKELLTQTTKAAITLSQAGMIDLATATSVTAESLNQFGEGADQADRFINVIAAGAKEGSAEINDMGAALKNSGTVAASQNVSFEQTNAVLQSMSTIALKGGEAGTGLRNFLLTLGSGADETNPKVVGLDKALKNLGKQNLSTAELTKLFGKENVTAAQHIITHREEIAQLTQKVTGTSEAFSQAEKNNASLDHQLEVFWARLSGLGLLLGTYLIPLFTKLVEGATGLTKLLTGGLTPASEAATQAFEDQRQKVQDLNKNLAPLLSRHDELKKKTKLSTDEQLELKKIVGQVASIVPSAVSEFDKYGNALDINTGKAREFIKVQQELLKYNNKAAIQETEAELASKKQALYEGVANRVNGYVSERDPLSMGGGFRRRKMTDAELAAQDAQNAKLRQEVADLEARRSGLNGDYLNTPAGGSATPAAAKPTGGGSGGGGLSDAQKAAQKKAATDAKQRAEELEKLLADARVNALKAEQSDYDKAVTAFAEKYSKMYELAGKDTKKINEIETLSLVEMAAIQASFSEKRAAQQQKDDVKRLQEIGEEAEAELKLKKELALLDIKQLVAQKGSGITKDRGKEMELDAEHQYLVAKQLMYALHYEEMANAAYGNEELLTKVTQDMAATMATINQGIVDNEGTSAEARAETRQNLTERINRSALAEAEFQQQMSQQLYSVMRTNWTQTLEGYKTFWKESSIIQKAALVAQKAWAIAEIAINLSRQISADLTAAALWNAMVPGTGFLYGAKYIALHTAQAAIQAAAVMSVGVQGFADGGFTGSGEGPAGWINSPTLFQMGNRKWVGGEAGQEFVISNKALQDPVVANFARIMDVAQKTGNYGLLATAAAASGGSGGSMSGGQGGAGGYMGMSQEMGMAILQQLQMNNSLMDAVSKRPIRFDVLAHERYMQDIEFAREVTKG